MTKQEDKELILAVIENAVKAGARKTKVCEALDIKVRTVQRWEKCVFDKRVLNNKSPKNKLSEEERQKVIDICSEDRFVDKSPKEIVPILAEEGTYVASESTLYRILREERMLNHREESSVPRKRHKVKELKATSPDQVWSWDITYLKTNVKGLFYYLYVFMDIWSRKIVAFDVFKEQTSLNARKTLMSVNDKSILKNLKLHSDNGSPMKGATFLATLHWLGITPSFSRPSVSNDNAYSESLFKTMKYDVSFPKSFESTEQAKAWVSDFVNWYNNEHRHSGIKYVTPEQRHSGEDKKILEIRKQTYENAKKRNPERWVQNKIRDWSWEKVQVLNPESNEQKRRQVA